VAAWLLVLDIALSAALLQLLLLSVAASSWPQYKEFGKVSQKMSAHLTVTTTTSAATCHVSGVDAFIYVLPLRPPPP